MSTDNAILSSISKLRSPTFGNSPKKEIPRMEIHVWYKETTFYSKSTFFKKTIGNAFPIDYVCSLSGHFTY